MTWDRWYQYTNEKFLVKQQAEIKQEELKHKQRKDEEKMANVLTMDFFSDENLSFNGNGMAIMGTNSKAIDQNLDNLCSTTTSNGSVMNKKMESEVEMANKTLDLTKNLQDVILEISELILDPDFVFALRKLKELGQAMKGSPSAAKIAQEASMITNLEKAKQAQIQQLTEIEDKAKNIKKELDYGSPMQVPSHQHKPMFPSASRTTFEQFSTFMKAPKRKVGASPCKGTGNLSSPKSLKKHGSTTNLKSLADTKMDIITEGLNVLKWKKLSKVAQSLWNEVASMGRAVLNPSDTSFYGLMSNVNLFPHFEKLQESARGVQLKADLFDFVRSSVEYSRVIIFHFI